MLGIDERHINFTGVGNSLFDGVGGDFAKRHAMHGSFLGDVDGLDDMPGNGFTFAVRVCCHIDGTRSASRTTQLRDDVFFVGHDDIGGSEIMVDVD